jgi:hypothetical protein
MKHTAENNICTRNNENLFTEIQVELTLLYMTNCSQLVPNLLILNVSNHFNQIPLKCHVEGGKIKN